MHTRQVELIGSGHETDFNGMNFLLGFSFEVANTSVILN